MRYFYFALNTNSGTQSKQVMDYWVATEYDGDTPDGLLKFEVPASKWVVFEVHGPMPDSMQKAWNQIFSEWLPSSGYEHAGKPALEVYTDEDPFSPDFYSEIWIPVNKQELMKSCLLTNTLINKNKTRMTIKRIVAKITLITYIPLLDIFWYHFLQVNSEKRTNF
ncbi:GyrI-like domain-containing protein [Geobacillus sp. GHH01]|uniref:GyrI-like domain-containing protein n=1 Tax=Geobacillus sp. GHH01 TaxID=1233873 RepID=UPI00211086E4|nr:GyrI-like domain-containing protein [Geobacillus sp. GHH01]